MYQQPEADEGAQSDSNEEDSEEREERNKDFFESMVYWRQEQDRKKGAQGLQVNTA
jgi:hypothetical protein